MVQSRPDGKRKNVVLPVLHEGYFDGAGKGDCASSTLRTEVDRGTVFLDLTFHRD